jgi:RNA polymerase sigma factor (sigma-70 family)
VTAENQGLGLAGPATPTARSPTPASGSRAAIRAEWTCFYDDNYYRVVRFLMHNGASQPDAEDAAHDAFTESYDLATSRPDRWQAITCRAAWIRVVALRKYRRPPGPRRRPLGGEDELPDLPASGLGPEDLTVQAQVVLRALQALDDEERAVIAFDIDGIPAADIACHLGVTQQRVRDVRKKARTALKQQLTKTMTPGGGGKLEGR